MLVGCCFLLTPKNFKIQDSKLRRVNRRFFLAARQKPSKTWLLLSLRQCFCRDCCLRAVIFPLSSFIFHLSSFIFHLSSFILNSLVGLHPKDYRHKMRGGSEVDEQMPYQMVVAEGFHRVEYCADGVEYST